MLGVLVTSGAASSRVELPAVTSAAGVSPAPGPRPSLEGSRLRSGSSRARFASSAMGSPSSGSAPAMVDTSSTRSACLTAMGPHGQFVRLRTWRRPACLAEPGRCSSRSTRSCTSPRRRATSYAAAGLRGGWMGYFASRSAPMGAVSAEVVAAVFHNFQPAMVRRAIPDAWRYSTPGARARGPPRGRRHGAAPAVGRRGRGSPDVSEAAELAMEVAARPAGRRPPALRGARRAPVPDGRRTWRCGTRARCFASTASTGTSPRSPAHDVDGLAALLMAVGGGQGRRRGHPAQLPRVDGGGVVRGRRAPRASAASSTRPARSPPQGASCTPPSRRPPTGSPAARGSGCPRTRANGSSTLLGGLAARLEGAGRPRLPEPDRGRPPRLSGPGPSRARTGRKARPGRTLTGCRPRRAGMRAGAALVGRAGP